MSQEAENIYHVAFYGRSLLTPGINGMYSYKNTENADRVVHAHKATVEKEPLGN